MGYCIVEGCNSKSDVNQGIKLHILPQNDEERLRKWLEAIGKMGLKVAQHGRVCSRHFSINDYYKSRSGMIDCLKKEAVPSLNLPGDIESRRLANTGITYRWDEMKKAYVDSSINHQTPAKVIIKKEKIEDDDVIVVGEGDKEEEQEEPTKDVYVDEDGACTKCEIVFRRRKDLLSHLKKVHVSIPTIVVAKLPNTHPLVRKLLQRQSSNDGLKLKIRSLGSEKFQVIQKEQDQQQQQQQPTLRILKPNEMKWSPPSSERIKREKQELFDESHSPNHLNDFMNHHPINQFPGDGYGGNNTDDILKKLLEEQRDPPAFHMNETYIQHHPHQIPQGPTSHHHELENEFISIDNLGNICSVCQCHFQDRMDLETHKRMTGHDMHLREPPPLAIMGNQQQIRFQVQTVPPPRPPMNNWHPARPPMLHPAPPFLRPGQIQIGPAPGPMRTQYTHHTANSHPYNAQSIRVLQPNQRAPMPPLYRVPVTISQHPNHRPPQHRPLFQMTSSNAPQKQSIFLKSRLQKPINVHSNGNDSNANYAIHPQQAVLSNQTAIRPRFLSPPAPAPGSNQFQSVTVPIAHNNNNNNVSLKEESNTPSPKLPKIQSVHSGVNPSVTIEDLQLEPTESDRQIRSPPRTSEDMASVLVQRGITITRNKPTTNGVTIKSEPQSEHQENTRQDSITLDDSLMACPVNTCKEKFVTEIGLQKHVDSVHKKEPMKIIVRGGHPFPTHDKPQTISIKNGLILKTFRCSICPAHFTTQHGLVQHQSQHQKPEDNNSGNVSPQNQTPMLKASLVKGNQVPNEIGIPLVDLSNEVTRRKLTNLGIYNFIPVANRDLAPGGFFGFPVVSLQGASNPAICNLGELGASSILSIGPVRQIPK